MKLPKFVSEFNFGHVLTLVGMIGVLIGIWRATEMRALEAKSVAENLTVMFNTEKSLSAEVRLNIYKRMDVFESNQRDIIKSIEGLAVNQAKVATLLDERLKPNASPIR